VYAFETQTMNTQFSRELAIFAGTLSLPAGDQRAAYLDQACSGDAELRQRVETLLKAHADAGTFLQAPAAPAAGREARFFETATLHAVTEKPGDKIGRYKLRETIGEGGCGVVYVAEQEEPVRRRVALKVIKPGMDSKSVIARFEAERQALAMMDHPNIAKVLDAGTTENGRPYFVMELVRGVRITDYCDQNRLSTRQRLDLFILVCNAVQHAHQKGIIHRDLKPSNILVTVNDGVPVPKVIDFGIAKATEGRLTDLTVYTELHQFIGTPAYMSPEQAEMTSLDIDTRSDIYSLGVLLYELLTGRTPFDPKKLMEAGLDEIRRTIREVEPPRPSTRLSTLANGDLTTVARARGSEAIKLVSLVRGDLDWIVMRALEKDRTRRYDTANGFAMDVKRFLGNEPVVARPPSATYRFQKLVRRNKLAFTAAAGVAAVLVLGVVVSTWQAARATRAQREQSRLRGAAEKASASEAVQRQLAEAQRNVAEEQRQLASMQLAFQAWEEGDLQRANALLEVSRPAPGQVPPFEWRYLRKLCQDQSLETFGSPNRKLRSALFFDRDVILLHDEKTLTLHNLSHRKDQLLLEDQDGISKPAFCCGNTNLLATVTDDGRIKVWDLTASRVQVEFEGHPSSPMNSVTFSRDGRWLASAASRPDRSVKLWDVLATNRQPVRTVHRYSEGALGVVFSSDRGHLFSSGAEGTISAWDVVSGAQVSALEGHTGPVWKLATSPDGLQMASGSADGTVILWDLNSRELLMRLFGHSGGVRALAFSPDGQMLASGGFDQIIRVWDLTNKNQPLAPLLLRGHAAPVACLSFSPDGQSLVSRSEDGLAKLWQIAPGHEGSALISGREVLYDVGLSPDGCRLASVGEKGAVNLWDLPTRRRILLPGHTDLVMCTAFSSDGRILATGSADRTVRLWDASNHTAIAVLTNEFPVGSLAFSPDGRRLIAGGSIFSHRHGGLAGLRFWDVPSRRATGAVQGDDSDIVEVGLSAEGSLLATGHKDGSVGLWDAETRRLLRRFVRQFETSVMSLAFSPTEPLLAAGDWGGNIVFYNTTTLEVLATPLKAHTFMASSLAFSPDGRTLASYGDGGGLKLWRVATRQVALTLKGHGGWVSGIAFSRDGNLMASCGAEGAVRLWPAAAVEGADWAPRK
jgi:WD40 repeat protein/serine/threonine protein kinase